MGKFKYIILLAACLFTTSAIATVNSDCANSQSCYNSGVYIYEGSQDLVDLYSNHIATSYNLNSNDDTWSSQVAFGFEWNRWGQNWGHAKMSTNGCVNLRGGSSGGNSNVCSDYTPQSLPYRNYTLYPLWTDLIRGTASGGQTSKMLFKAFDDYVVFGWYYMKEYNRSSSNSFEAILYDNNSYEYRYRELDIFNHDVLIGEQGNNATTPADTKTFLYYNDYTQQLGGCQTFDMFLEGAAQCNTQYGNAGGPDLENGGSLYSGSFTEMCDINALYSTDCSGYAAAVLAQECAANALYSESCSGYAVAYFNQQCGLNTLYDEECTGYATAYLIQQCDLDTLYSSQCDGYNSALAAEEALYDAIYGTDDDIYGYDGSDAGQGEYGGDGTWSQYGYDDDGNAYTQDDMWYDEEYGEYLDPNDPCYQNACEGFTDADWYALDIEQFGQEQVDEWYGQDVQFSDEGYMDFEQYGTTEEEFFSALDANMDQYDIEQEQYQEELAYLEQLATEEEYAEMFTEEAVEYFVETVANMETDADWYDYEVETFGQEQVDEWWGEEVSFDEEGYVSETFAQETSFEEVLIANADDIYILEETIGVEIFVEEEWSTDEELDIYEEVLEDYELEALETQEEEVFEEFEETYEEEELYIEEDEAFEELINEEELEELINEDREEEFFEEAQEEELFDEEGDDNSGSNNQREKKSTIMIAQQQVQQEQQTIQQAVSQDSAPSSSQAVVSAIDFGGTQQDQSTVADVLQEQLDDGSGSTTGGSFDSNSFSTGGGTMASSNQQQQISESTGDTQIMEQQEQLTGQSQIQVAEVVDAGPAVSAFEVSEQQQEQQQEQQVLTFDDGSSFTTADQNFESSFDDALGSGQSIGQFLSNQAPSFAKFDIAPPTVSEQQVSSAVESLADRVGSQVAAQNLQTQLDTVQEGGGFDVDQTATVAYIGYSSGFSDYTGQAQLSDRDDWYISKTLYKDNKIDDNKFSFYMMAGKTQKKLQEMINSQYKQ